MLGLIWPLLSSSVLVWFSRLSPLLPAHFKKGDKRALWRLILLPMLPVPLLLCALAYSTKTRRTPTRRSRSVWSRRWLSCWPSTSWSQSKRHAYARCAPLLPVLSASSLCFLAAFISCIFVCLPTSYSSSGRTALAPRPTFAQSLLSARLLLCCCHCLPRPHFPRHTRVQLCP